MNLIFGVLFLHHGISILYKQTSNSVAVMLIIVGVVVIVFFHSCYIKIIVMKWNKKVTKSNVI